MKPIGPLMFEHRLIERMFGVLHERIETMNRIEEFDASFFNRLLDFFKVYIDKAHHGKEEDILFKTLLSKPLSDEHRNLINELIAEHASGRRMFQDMEDAVNGVIRVKPGSKDRIVEVGASLENLYKKHIEKEDSHFFFPVMQYLNREEQNKMLSDMAQYDTKILHDKYKALVTDWEKVQVSPSKKIASP